MQKDFRKNKPDAELDAIFNKANEKKTKEQLRYKNVEVGGVKLVIKKWTATERMGQLPSFMNMWYAHTAAMMNQNMVDVSAWSQDVEVSSLSAAELTMAFLGRFQDIDFIGWIKDFCSNVSLESDKEHKTIDIDDTFDLDEHPTALIELIQEVAQANFMMRLSQAISSMPDRLLMENMQQES
jgi:hypothetical protein